MRRYLLLSIFFLLATVSYAQVRVVRGAVKTETGAAFPNVLITTEYGETFSTKSDGTFEIRVSSSCKSLTFSAEKYAPAVIAIDGSYLLVRMKINPEAIMAEESTAREARLAEEERQRAERDSLAAVERARREGLAESERAQRESLAASERARRDSLAAAERARLDSIALVNQMLDEEEARLFAERRARLKAKIKENVGGSIRASYAIQMASCEVAYRNSGYRSYGSLHPFTIDYTLSYKLNDVLSVGVGAGVLYNAKSITIAGDRFVFYDDTGNSFSFDSPERRLEIPLFATLSIHPGSGKVRPSIAISGGVYPLSSLFLVEGMLGAEYRLGQKRSIEAGLIFKTTPYPYFDMDKGIAGYKVAASPGFAVRFNH